MCGHVGSAGNISFKHEKVFKTLLILDSLRGIDSTGVAVVNRKGEVKIAKSVGNPFILMDTKRFDRAMQGFNCVMIGHNRYATQGSVSDRNAHPFDFDTLVGAHNGTLRNKHVLDNHTDYDVDSENLYHHMDKNGVEDTIHKLDGAWCLIWFNKDEGTLNFLRNKERPLHMCYTNDGETLFWASEKWMLSVALSREAVEHQDIFELPVDSWWKMEVYDDGTLGKPHVTPLKTKVPEPLPITNIYALPHRHQQQKPAVDAKKIEQQTGGAQKGETKSSAYSPNPYKAGVEYALLVTGTAVDRHGSAYYICSDRKNPKEIIRLYRHASDRVELLNKDIVACIHMFRYSDRDGAYHKVEYSSVRLANETVIEDKEERSYHDAKGKLIPVKEWMTKHGTCAWCTGHVDPEQAFKFTTSDEAICHHCAEDTEVANYVNFR